MGAGVRILMLRGWSLAAAAAALLGAFGVGPAAAQSRTKSTIPCPGLEPGPTRTVTRILEGETLVLDDGRELRLLGTLAPRAIDADAEAGAWPAELATIDALRGLVLGKSVELRFAGERTDRYRRLQAHAFLTEDGGDSPRWIQGHLVERGLARASSTAGDHACSAELLVAERSAREARRGLWADAAYQVRPAEKPSELLRYRASFQIVEGRIVGIGQTRGAIYLNFDRNWRQGFSVRLRRDDRRLLGDLADNPKGLEGRSVRVRGWVAQRGKAPVIDLSEAGGIEILGDSPAPIPGEPESPSARAR
jgi:micrococcal nuclease